MSRGNSTIGPALEISSRAGSRRPPYRMRPSVCTAKLGDTRLLKARGPSDQNASNHTQCAKCPHCPSRNINLGKSSEVNNCSNEERNNKEDPALRPPACLYRVVAMRTHRSGTNNAAFGHCKLIPLRPRIRSTGAQICRSPDVFTAPRTIQFRPHVI